MLLGLLGSPKFQLQLAIGPSLSAVALKLTGRFGVTTAEPGLRWTVGASSTISPWVVVAVWPASFLTVSLTE